MPEELSINDFLLRPSGVPIIDVRTPDEFADGHIPGAVNVPLFSNKERVEIGTAYKQQSRNSAVSLGLRCVGPRLSELAEQLLELAGPSDPCLYIHCWRGGMRSGSVAWLMEAFCCRVAVLKGGYKSFRRWVLGAFDTRREVHVVSGLTGSGKTPILLALAEMGASIVDLEGLARHKGSVFGQLGEEPQPSQAQFENELALAWRATDPAHPVWLEDESRMIGKVVLPEALWAQKQAARFHVIELPIEQRVNHLCAGYGGYAVEELEARVNAIARRLGGDRAKAAIEALHQRELGKACRLILLYYDRTYQKCLELHPDSHIVRHAFTQLDPQAIAAVLKDSIPQMP